MPRYFFDFKRDNQSPDMVCVDLPDLAAARAEAVRTMGQDLKDAPEAFWNDERWQVEVSDDNGVVLFTLHSAATHASAQPGQSERE